MNSFKKQFNRNVLSYAFSIAAVLLATILICLLPDCGKRASLTFRKSYYLVAVAAEGETDAIALAKSCGGAGYDFAYEGAHYGAIACYYSETNALTVVQNLKRTNLETQILAVSTETYPLHSSAAAKNKELYAGNLATLYSLSSVIYECANGRADGNMSAAAVVRCLADAGETLNGLVKANPDNCFTSSLENFAADLENAAALGDPTPSELRYLQIKIIDFIVNIQLI